MIIKITPGQFYSVSYSSIGYAFMSVETGTPDLEEKSIKACIHKFKDHEIQILKLKSYKGKTNLVSVGETPCGEYLIMKFEEEALKDKFNVTHVKKERKVL
jgi:hypothetical protein